MAHSEDDTHEFAEKLKRLIRENAARKAREKKLIAENVAWRARALRAQSVITRIMGILGPSTSSESSNSTTIANSHQSPIQSPIQSSIQYRPSNIENREMPAISPIQSPLRDADEMPKTKRANLRRRPIARMSMRRDSSISDDDDDDDDEGKDSTYSPSDEVQMKLCVKYIHTYIHQCYTNSGHKAGRDGFGGECG